MNVCIADQHFLRHVGQAFELRMKGNSKIMINLMIALIPDVVIVDPVVNSSEPQPTDPTKHTSKSAIDKKAGWLFNAVIETCKEYQNCKSV